MLHIRQHCRMDRTMCAMNSNDRRRLDVIASKDDEDNVPGQIRQNQVAESASLKTKLYIGFD